MASINRGLVGFIASLSLTSASTSSLFEAQNQIRLCRVCPDAIGCESVGGLWRFRIGTEFDSKGRLGQTRRALKSQSSR